MQGIIYSVCPYMLLYSQYITVKLANINGFNSTPNYYKFPTERYRTRTGLTPNGIKEFCPSPLKGYKETKNIDNKIIQLIG